MKALFGWVFLALAVYCSVASDGRIVMGADGTNTLLQVYGDDDEDWRIQTSTDLLHWSTLTNPASLLSDQTNPPAVSVGDRSNPGVFFRALRTAGLYDPSLFRKVSLTFTQANWSGALASARTYNTNVHCTMVTLDNGATNLAVGARYKGNTSYTMSGVKKSINLEFNYSMTNSDLMRYETVNLNNAAGDETIMREALYFTVMEKYTPCPKGSMTQVWINNSFWGVYSLVQQENGQLINEWFPSNRGDRWRAPNAPIGGFTSSNSAFAYFGNTNVASYRPHYELKSDNSTTNDAFARLINAIYVLNLTPTNNLRDRIEDVFALDNWLWFLAIENIFADDDSYLNKGADYGFYYEPESGRIHPVEHDGNEAFVLGDVSLSPVMGVTGRNRPLLYRLLPIPDVRQRYLAHMRTVLEEYYNPTVMTPMINTFHAMSINAILADPNKGFTMTAYTNDLNGLRQFVTNRYNFLRTHAELSPLQPNITSVSNPPAKVFATNVPFITASVSTNGNSGLESVWLYHRGKPYGRFNVAQMFDDGAHGDGAADDGVFGAASMNYPAGTKVRYYIEARGSNSARAARFSPARAENETWSYRVAVTTASATPVIINELMALNTNTVMDPQGEYEDWIELRNITDSVVDLSGRYLSDEANNPRKWQFPAGTTIPADGYLVIWADEDSTVAPGLHASFRLAASGEALYLADTDANLNQVLDTITWGQQEPNISYGRQAADADVWNAMEPTPGKPNK